MSYVDRHGIVHLNCSDFPQAACCHSCHNAWDDGYGGATERNITAEAADYSFDEHRILEDEASVCCKVGAWAKENPAQWRGHFIHGVIMALMED